MPAKKNQAANPSKKIKKPGQIGKVTSLDTQTLHAALDAAPAAMIITRFDGRILYANRQCREQYGFKREDLGRNIVVFFQDPDEYQAIVRQLRRKGRLDSRDVRAYGQGLARIWIMLSAQTIQLDGETAILASLSNVTARKLLEEQNRIIAETQARLLQTLDSKEIFSLVAEKVGQLVSRDGVVATTVLDEGKQVMRVVKVAGLDVPKQRIIATLGIDPYRMEGRLEDMTETELRLFRSGKLELLDGGLYALMTRRISKSLCKAGEKLLRVEKIYVMGFVWQQIHLGGLIILARCDISPYLETIELIVNQAVTAINRLRAEAALGEREAIFHNLFNNSEVGMIRSRLDGSEVLDMNEKYLKIFGRRREEMLGKPSLPHWADPKQREEMVERIKADGRVVDFECKMLDQNGEVHDCLTSLNLYRDEGIIEGSILDVTESKMAEQALRESEERFRKVFEEGFVGMVLTSRNLKFFSANPAFCRMLGYTVEEMSSKSFLDVTHPDHREADRTNVEKMWRGELPSYKTEKRYIAKNGEIRWGSLSTSIIRGQDGRPLYALAMVEDITERKRTEIALKESEWRNKIVSEMTVDYIFVVDVGAGGILKLRWASENMLRMTGRTIADVPTSDLWRNIFHPDDLPRYYEFSKQIITTAQAGEIECRTYNKDGLERWVLIYAKPQVDEKNVVTTIIGAVRDITKRKQAEEALNNSTAQYRTLVENTPDIIARFDKDARYLFVNSAISQVSLLKPEYFIGKTLNDVGFPKEQAKQRESIIRSVVESGKPVETELESETTNGLQVFELRAYPEFDPAGNVQSVLVINRNITQRKQAEQALRESEEQHRIILQTALEGFWMADAQGHLLEVNEAYCRMSGYSRSELLSMRISELEAEELADDTAAHMQKVIVQGEDRFATRHRRKDGSTYDIEVSVQYQPVGGGRFVGFFHDVTESKRAEEALRESEVKFRAMIEQASEGFALVDEEGLIIEWNKAEEAIWGLKREDVLGRLFCDVQFQVVVPERRTPERYEFFKTTMLEALRTGQSPVFGRLLDAELCRPDGARVFVQQTASPIKTSRGYRLVSMAADVTKRKRVEEALRENEEKFRRLFETSRDFLYVTDMEGRIVDCNKMASDLTGYSQEELKNLNIQELYYDAREREALVAKITQQGFVENYSIRGRKKDGTIADGLVSSTVIKDEKGNAIGFQGGIKDISELKRAEEALRQSETALKNAQRVSHVGSWMWHIQSNQLEWSDEMYRIFGIEKENFSGNLPDVIGVAIHPEDRAKVEESNLSVVKEKKPIPLEYRIIRPGGTVRVVWAEAGELVLDQAGQPAILTGIVQDITERKRAEEDLKKRMDELVTWQKATLGREGRVMELKNEINELLAELSRPPRYEKQS